VKALHRYAATDADELSFEAGELISVIPFDNADDQVSHYNLYFHLIHPHPLTDSTHHPRWHPDPISRFSTIHPPDRQTDRQMG